MDVLEGVAIVLVCGLGFFAWGFVEYLIHGVLSHRLRTPVSPLHWGHHREPRAVFTSPIAWVPVALVMGTIVVASAGWLGLAFMLGLLVGFARYERMHWRLHFREPRNEREARLRAHHLVHHFRNPQAYHGVTTHRWDRWLGTLPPEHESEYASVAELPPIEGPSNWGRTWRLTDAWVHVRRSAFRT